MAAFILSHLHEIIKERSGHGLFLTKTSDYVLPNQSPHKRESRPSKLRKKDQREANRRTLFLRSGRSTHPRQVDGPALRVSQTVKNCLPALQTTSFAQLRHQAGRHQLHLSPSTEA
uniref:Uncharacterized protein n=1 Tax=Nymphaea colorata TaxID=210225 RepID=A0A5K0Y4P0_9MAGN